MLMWVLDKREVAPFQRLDQPGAELSLDVNRCAIFADMARGPLGEVHDDDELFWTLSSLPWATFNAVSHSRVGGNALDDAIHEKQAYYQRKGRSLIWWATPYSAPGLVERLLANGFVHRSSFPGMAADLRDLPASDQLTIPPHARIARVTDEAALRDWARTCLVAFGDSLDIVGPAVDVFKGLALHNGSAWRCYLATVDGQPASTAGVMMTGGVAGIYWVGTPPAHRRLGLGTAVTAAALRDAYAEGYRIACLTASPLGRPIYAKLGFKEYAEFHTYRWPPPQTS
jgi:ribosomal protein S18 acetylase RimI-like enzyme